MGMHMSTRDHIFSMLLSVDYKTAVSAVRLFYADHLARNRESHAASMLAFGFKREGVNTFDSIVDKYGERWFVDREKEKAAVVTNSPKAVAIEPQTKVLTATEARAGISCPKCGDAMQEHSICPACKAGKSGLKFKYSCPCGVQFMSEVKL